MRLGNSVRLIVAVFGLSAIASHVIFIFSAGFLEPGQSFYTFGPIYATSLLMSLAIFHRRIGVRIRWPWAIMGLTLLGVSGYLVVLGWDFGRGLTVQLLDQQPLYNLKIRYDIPRWIWFAPTWSFFSSVGSLLVGVAIWCAGCGWRSRLTLLMAALGAIWGVGISWLDLGGVVESDRSLFMFPGSWQVPMSLIAGYWVATASPAKQEGPRP